MICGVRAELESSDHGIRLDLFWTASTLVMANYSLVSAPPPGMDGRLVKRRCGRWNEKTEHFTLTLL